MRKLQPPPPEKSHPPLSQRPPLKVEVLSSPPFLKIWLEAQPPPPSTERMGVPTMLICLTTFFSIYLHFLKKDLWIMAFILLESRIQVNYY